MFSYRSPAGYLRRVGENYVEQEGAETFGGAHEFRGSCDLAKN